MMLLKCCQISEKSRFSAREQSIIGPAKYPSRSGNHMADADKLIKGLAAQVNFPNLDLVYFDSNKFYL